jgi:hypothetical protein
MSLGTDYGRWFRNTEDILFGVEFLLVQLFLIYHLVRVLFYPGRR